MNSLNYNPDQPCTVGTEWMPYIDDIAYLGSPTDSYALKLRASTADTIESFWLALCAINSHNSCLVTEIFELVNGDLPAFSDLVATWFYPGNDVYNFQAYGYGAFSGYTMVQSGLWQAVSNPANVPGIWPNSGRPVYDDSFIFNIYGYDYEYAANLAGINGVYTNQWITNIRLVANVNELIDYAFITAMTVTPYIQIDGVRYLGSATTVSGESPTGIDIYYDWPANPATGLPWTGADMDAFETGSNAVGFRVERTNSSNNLATICHIGLIVVAAPTDERERIGVMCPETPVGWHETELLDPTTGAPSPMTLVEGGEYLFLFRKTTGGSPLATCRLDEPGKYLTWLGPPHWTSYIPPLSSVDERGSVSLRPRELGWEFSTVSGMVLQISPGTMSQDSQPYATTSPVGDAIDAWVPIDVNFNNSPVNVDRTLEQEFEVQFPGDYVYLQLRLAQHSNMTDGDLTVSLYDRGTNTLQCTPWVFTSDDLEAPKRGWQRIGLMTPDLVGASLVPGTQYYIKIASPASASQGWHVQVANGGQSTGPVGGPPAGSDDATFGGSTNVPTINGVDEPNMDVEFLLSTPPDTPTGFTATANGEQCGIDFISLGWTPPVPVVNCLEFSYYEIQRSDDLGETWKCIAKITAWGLTTFDDYESIRNSPAQYRMRVVRSEGAPSFWTPIVTATATLTEVGLLFTSNESPLLTVFYKDIERERVYNFPENVTIHQPHDRNYQIAFGELEDRGTTFDALVLLRAGSFACAVDPCYDFESCGSDVFRPIRNIARAGLSYVCVHNECGDRWFSNVQTPTGTWRRGKLVDGANDPNGIYTQKVTVTEVTDNPTCVDSAFGGNFGSGSGDFCFPLYDNFDRANGPAVGPDYPTTGVYTFSPSDWNIEAFKLLVGTDGGFTSPTRMATRMVTCCHDKNWYESVRVFTDWANASTYDVGFADDAAIAGEYLQARFTLGPTPGVEIHYTGGGTVAFPLLNPSRIDPSNGSALQVRLAANGFAAYVDGVPYGFIDAAAIAALPVTTTGFRYIAQLATSAVAVETKLNSLIAGCLPYDTIDETPFA